MPKEVVYDKTGLYDAVVGWSPGQWVQLGIQSADGLAIVDKLIEKPSGELRATVDKLTGSGELAAFTALWGTFDRDGVNRMIRMLRRARDSAFGRDE